MDVLLVLAWDPACAACGQPLRTPTAGPVCHPCWARVRDGARLGAAGAYDGALRRVVQAFKYAGHRSLAAPLAALMIERGREILEDADLVVPVPLHPAKRLRRGFNQAEDLARQLPRPVLHALHRVRATRAQAGLDAHARFLNVARAFAPAWRVRLADRIARRGGLAARWFEGWSVRGRIVVLVDDVRTTGATVEACAEVLRRSGAREVRVLTVAAVPRP